MNEPHFTITEVQDEREIARFRAQDEQARRNSAWLQAHWQELLPQALGKFLAVAGQQAFIADTPQQAQTLAKAAHLDDRGILVQYVRPERGSRLYLLCKSSVIGPSPFPIHRRTSPGYHLDEIGFPSSLKRMQKCLPAVSLPF